jgi:putative ABC transport system permease protein
MRWTETLRIALDAIRTHRMRSLLTVLGIWIGIASVTLIVGLGQGAQQAVQAQISSLGTNLLVITPGSTTTTGGIRAGRGSATTLTTSDAAALTDRAVAPDIAHVAPVRSSSTVLAVGATTWTTSVTATTPDWLSVRARSVAAGRFITQDDLDADAHVVVLGATTVDELFPSGTGVGQDVTIDGTPYTVIDELAITGTTAGLDQDDLAVLPITTAEQSPSNGLPSGTLSSIFLEATSQTRLSAAYQEAYAALLTRHNVTAETADFSIASQQSLVQAATTATQILTVLLGGIAGISLLVGGIGS